MNENQKVPVLAKLCYGCGAAGGNVMSTILAAFLLSYYTDSAMMGMAAIGTMFLISRVLDGITDVAMGGIVDKTNTRWGKARPWLLVSAPKLKQNALAGAPTLLVIVYASKAGALADVLENVPNR